MPDQQPVLRVVHTPNGVALRGEIDAHTCPLVTEAMRTISTSGDVTVELSGVTFVDSSGLRALLEVHHQLQREQRRMIVLDPSPTVVRLIEIAGLVAHLHIEPPLGPPT